MKLKSTLTALAKAFPPLPNCALRSSVAAGLILHFTLYTLYSPAAEPLCWERTPNRPAPAQFDTFHGQSLDFRCTFTGFGALPFGPGAISGSGASAPFLYYQTNGMGAAWWSLPATVSSNVLAATFPPSADPGAERLTIFFGAPSNAYSAAQVRFRNSPGATPNHLDPPSVLDWQAELAAATNDLFKSFAPTITNTYTKAETDARIAELAPRTSLAPATNYTDTATNALWESSAAELRKKADLSRTVVFTNSIIVPERIDGDNWTYGNSRAGGPTGDLVRDAALTASATDGSIYWSAQTDYTIEGEWDTQFYRYAIAWYNPYMETFRAAVWSDQLEPMPSVVADIGLDFADQVDDFRSVLGLPWPESFATLDTPKPDAVDWNEFVPIRLLGTSTAYVPTQAVETVVYSLDLAAATNDLHKSLAPTISNTVTKAYVESLGIESGVDAQTVTNMTALTPVYSQTPAFGEWVLSGNNVQTGFHVVPGGYDPISGKYGWRLVDGNGVMIVDTLVPFDATTLSFDGVNVTATRTRTDIIGYTLGTQTNSVLAATNSIISSSTITNIASTVSSNAIASADTTYRRTIGITNLNQSVQYVSITDPSPSTLAITMPTDGATKDWMVYVTAVTNVSLVLPSATWWMADVAYTNDVPPATPTAFYFSQVTDGIFILGRQELTEVTAP